MGQNELAVVDLDIDDPDLITMALDVFGTTPIIIRTRRGFHLYYRSFDWLGAKSGPAIDLKAGASFVVAPLSEYKASQFSSSGSYNFVSREFDQLSDEVALVSFVLAIKHRLLPLIKMDKAHVFFG